MSTRREQVELRVRMIQSSPILGIFLGRIWIYYGPCVFTFCGFDGSVVLTLLSHHDPRGPRLG